MERRAKIVATLGPASSDEGVLAELVAAGVDLVRLNLSHGSHAEHAERIARVRRVADSQDRHLAVVADLMGPRYRLGEVPGGTRALKAGEVVTLGASDGEVDLPIDDPELLRHLQPGERMLLDSGLIELRIEGKEGALIRARVVNPGEVSTRKGINLPETQIPFTISDKDKDDIAFAVREGADFVAASYVGEAAHVRAVRDAVRQAGGRSLPIIAKLERATAVSHLEEITAAADGIMVARGDLGVEVPLATLPVLQKKIVAAGRRAGKPVIVATQMLESMIEQPRPTRAEATDVANAVFDGADALMLSGETAVGKHAVAAVATMAQIIREAEGYERQRHAGRHTLLRPLADAQARHAFELALEKGEDGAQDRPGVDPSPHAADIPDVVSAAAVYAAGELGVARIVAWSQSGFTARLAARYRPAVPLVALTPNAEVARQLQLVWGVRPLVAPGAVEHLDDVMQAVDRQLQAAGLAEPGARIIVLMGHPIRERPLTNLLRVHRVRSVEEWERIQPRP